jgi:hypothetical protein
MTDLNKRLHVVLLTRSGCSLCDQAQDLLSRLASDYPLAITTLDADESDGAALAARTGVLFTPGIVIGTDTVISGHITERPLRKAIERQLRGHGRYASSRAGSGRSRSLRAWLRRRP